MLSLLLKAALAAVVCCTLSVPASAAPRADEPIRIVGDEKRTVGEYSWAAGKVCFSIRNDDGSAGSIKMWVLGLNEIAQRVYHGAACFNIVGFAKVRAGYADGGPVTVRVAHDNVARLPFTDTVR